MPGFAYDGDIKEETTLLATLCPSSRTEVFYWVFIFLFYIGFHVFIYLQYLQSRMDRAVKHRPAERLIKARDGFGRSV